MSNARSAFNRIYYVAGKHLAYPGKWVLMRAWLTINQAKRILWLTRLSGETFVTEEEAKRAAERANFGLDQPTFTDIHNGKPLTFEQVRVLEGYRQIKRSSLKIEEETIFYGKGQRRS